VPFRRGYLRYFVTVAEEGQITRAAAKLGIAQPALSHAIARLESEVGLRLLERDSRGISLTADGRRFYEKARAAVDAHAEALHTVRALARSERGTLAFGFVGVPPSLDSRGLLEAFAKMNPDVDIHYRELPFPSTSTADWLSEVDVAVCHSPPADTGVWTQPLRLERRVALLPERHHLAERGELSIADVLEEAFIGMHPTADPIWAGFWSLDDHRGAPPRVVTGDRAANAQEVLAALAVRNAITTVPAAVAAMIPGVLSGVAAVPLCDAEPAAIELVGRNDRRGAAVGAVLGFAAELAKTSAGGQRASA
jgi:DNA-binding transcriptional LysR family regulator